MHAKLACWQLKFNADKLVKLAVVADTLLA
jgi:hypothetical protein